MVFPFPQKNLFHPLVSLEWESCASLPTVWDMQDVQAVVLNNKVYVSPADIVDRIGRGVLKMNTGIICIYDVSGNSWKEIKSATSQHALAVYNNQLVLVGGKDPSTHACTNELRVLQDEELGWTQPLPPMPTERCNPSAAGIGSHLAVAGGHGPIRHYPIPLDTVEIFDSQEWRVAESLPKPSYRMKSVLQDNTWYLMGGRGQGREVYCTLLNDLIATPNPGITRSIWRKLPDVPFENSTPAVFMNELIAIGGEVVNRLSSLFPSQYTSKIHAYSTSVHSWVHVGDTTLPSEDKPTAYCSTCATTLPSGELFMVGAVNYPHRISTAHTRCEQVLKGSAKGNPCYEYCIHCFEHELQPSLAYENVVSCHGYIQHR